MPRPLNIRKLQSELKFLLKKKIYNMLVNMPKKSLEDLIKEKSVLLKLSLLLLNILRELLP
jgi:hypothetical protein